MHVPSTTFPWHSAQSQLSLRRRRGSLIVEMLVCVIVLSVVAGILSSGVQAVYRQRKTTRLETLALIELDNMATMVRLHRQAGDLALSDWFLARYPGSELSVEEIQTEEIADGLLRAARLEITVPGFQPGTFVRRALVVWYTDTGETM